MVENPTDLEAQAERVKQIEHECDEITHAVVEALHKTFITPIDRNDIYRAHHQDGRHHGPRRGGGRSAGALRHPDDDQGGRRPGALPGLQRRARAGRGVEHPRPRASRTAILQHCIEINRLENVADSILRGALARLFREEKDPIAVIKWKEIYETLESATDRCEDVANIIEGVVLENS